MIRHIEIQKRKSFSLTCFRKPFYPILVKAFFYLNINLVSLSWNIKSSSRINVLPYFKLDFFFNKFNKVDAFNLNLYFGIVYIQKLIHNIKIASWFYHNITFLWIWSHIVILRLNFIFNWPRKTMIMYECSTPCDVAFAECAFLLFLINMRFILKLLKHVYCIAYLYCNEIFCIIWYFCMILILDTKRIINFIISKFHFHRMYIKHMNCLKVK